jgi:hypothetical protein
MFIGSWIINIIFSIVAFSLVFIGSITTNTLFTSFIRGLLAFVCFYVITFFFRWLWMLASKNVFFEEVETQIENTEQGNSINKVDYSKEEIAKAGQYVKDLIND